MKNTAILLLACFCLGGCAMEAGLVRDAHKDDKISFPSTLDNSQSFKSSDFKSYLTYKTSLQSVFDVSYFNAYSYHSHQFNYVAEFDTDITINSSRLLLGDNIVILLNLFPDALTEKNGVADLTFYRFTSNSVISKRLTFQMELQANMLTSPGTYRSDSMNNLIRLQLKDRDGKLLYSNADDQSYVELKTKEVKDGVISGTLTADLGSPSGKLRYQIYEGEFWVKQ